ncbi:MAG: F0F1 ATP synthase subunit alpha [Clostridia bacterium]|nr:F0F1 ATP synthase subunit alpha [Clostridia bacterium]
MIKKNFDGFVAIIKSAKEPSKTQLRDIKDYLEKKHSGNFLISFEKDKSITEGFRIEISKTDDDITPDIVYDWSLEGLFSQFKEKLHEIHHDSDTDVVPLIKDVIDNFEPLPIAYETGTVVNVGDGVVSVKGLENVAYGEIVKFSSGVKGMVQHIDRERVGCILFGKDDSVRQGDRVMRTKKEAGIPVGDAFVGRIINALGEPIDGLGKIEKDEYRPIEFPAPSIPDRMSVCEPLQTGILAIDSMFPIGKGQRELIIGDRQTGKTSIAIDTIINQKDKDVICIYNAIGQKASSVAKIVNTLKKHNAMQYTIIVCSTASDPAALQYISPYSATALAEYFMYKGKDVLVVYDDLSKHAVAYRAISLLLCRSPGREAYPGDVFYLHSRLLERSSKLCDELGGGSITALPIIETQAGDVSAYIPTNVISITDGQIFLESDLFFSGVRPAVNVGLSVSRVGGSAQTKAMKKATGSLRIDLAQYREIEVFSQFSSDLDEDTKKQLSFGRGLIEILKQPLLSPLSEFEQVISLVVANNKLLFDVETSNIKRFLKGLIDYIKLHHAEIEQKIKLEKMLDDKLIESIVSVTNEYKGVLYNG